MPKHVNAILLVCALSVLGCTTRSESGPLKATQSETAEVERFYRFIDSLCGDADSYHARTRILGNVQVVMGMNWLDVVDISQPQFFCSICAEDFCYEKVIRIHWSTTTPHIDLYRDFQLHHKDFRECDNAQNSHIEDFNEFKSSLLNRVHEYKKESKHVHRRSQ
jgi:hypothetical protein